MFIFVFLCFMFCFLFCVFCFPVLFCVLFLPMYRVAYFLLVYNFTDNCHLVETQLQLINVVIIIITSYNILFFVIVFVICSLHVTQNRKFLELGDCVEIFVANNIS